MAPEQPWVQRLRTRAAGPSCTAGDEGLGCRVRDKLAHKRLSLLTGIGCDPRSRVRKVADEFHRIISH
jgi:hypothetical protein